MELLIVEDERSLAEDIKAYLEVPGTRCALAGNVREAMDHIVDKPFDCVIPRPRPSRWQRPGGAARIEADGQDRRRGDRVQRRMRWTTASRVCASGADDYIVKPIHLAELAVRVQATVRRAHFGGQDRLQFDELVIDLPGHTAEVNGATVPLTPTEFRLLRLLTASRDRVLPRQVIAEHLSDDPEDERVQELVYAHMKNLKRKLAEAGCSDRIHTVHGVGYRFSA
jgi:DNA-binding response OmpR family regulator